MAIKNLSDSLHSIVDVYVLDEDFHKIDVIDDYTSLIWSKRYYEVGDFELYCNASEKNRELLQLGRYVMRADDDEIFRIETIEIESSIEEGDFITATGRDLRSILFQRVTLFDWTYGETSPMRLELIVRQVVNNNFIHADGYTNVNGTSDADNLTIYNNPKRNIPHFKLGTDQGLPTVVASLEVEMQNIGKWIEDICDNYRWGWRVVYDGDNISDDYNLVFDVYKGEDKTALVIFSEDYENLLESKYKEDRSEYRNTYIMYDDDSNVTMTFGTKSGLDRYETTPDDTNDINNVAKKIRWDNLVNLYGWAWDGGYVNYEYDEEYNRGWGWFGLSGYRKLVHCRIWLDGYDFPLYGDEEWEAKVKQYYPDGEYVTKNGIRCWHTDSKIIFNSTTYRRIPTRVAQYNDQGVFTGYAIEYAETWADPETSGWNWAVDSFPKVSPAKPDTDHQSWLPSYTLTVPVVMQEAMMQDNAYSQIDLYTRDIEFEGTIEPNTTYEYKKDYDLGDLVTVRTKYGITKNVRISEVIETFDQDGYSIEVNFESEG